jgi:hypothetical protein
MYERTSCFKNLVSNFYLFLVSIRTFDDQPQKWQEASKKRACRFDRTRRETHGQHIKHGFGRKNEILFHENKGNANGKQVPKLSWIFARPELTQHRVLLSSPTTSFLK